MEDTVDDQMFVRTPNDAISRLHLAASVRADDSGRLQGPALSTPCWIGPRWLPDTVLAVFAIRQAAPGKSARGIGCNEPGPG